MAANYLTLMAGRALVGIVIGGFWSLSASTVMRLVAEDQVPRALALLNGGNAVATMVAPPLGSFLGHAIGWRGAFFMIVPLGVATLFWLFATLPAMPSSRQAGSTSVVTLLARPQLPFGIAAATLLFMGQFALFTYLRPFLEQVTRVDVATLSLILLIIGTAGVVGTYAIAFVLRGGLYRALIGAPFAMAAIALGLVLAGSSTFTTALLLAGWGLIGTAAPVAWWTWLSRVLPDDAEAGGGLMVAAVQLAITAGAALGGWLYDSAGYGAAFSAAALILAGSGLAATLDRRGAVAGSR